MIAKEVKMEIPAFISEAIRNGETSLGENPAFPPSVGNGIILSLIAGKINDVSSRVGGISLEDAKTELTELLTKCSKIEETCREALEQECMAIVTEIVKIPEDTLKIEALLVDKVDMSGARFMPEECSDYTYDSIADMKSLGDEVYKRRMMDSIVCGAALELASRIDEYAGRLFKINPELPSLYKKILDLNTYLMYNENVNGETGSGGKVDVLIGEESQKVALKSKGTTFPFLLCETLKGLFEIAASHGLPNSRRRAQYIIGKSDYTLAELWDTRLGSVIWDRIYEQATDVEPNLLIMKLSMMDTEEFNDSMREIIACTKAGKEIIDGLCDEISYEIDREDFDQYMDSKRTSYQINDEFLTREELVEG